MMNILIVADSLEHRNIDGNPYCSIIVNEIKRSLLDISDHDLYSYLSPDNIDLFTIDGLMGRKVERDSSLTILPYHFPDNVSEKWLSPLRNSFDQFKQNIGNMKTNAVISEFIDDNLKNAIKEIGENIDIIVTLNSLDYLPDEFESIFDSNDVYYVSKLVSGESHWTDIKDLASSKNSDSVPTYHGTPTNDKLVEDIVDIGMSLDHNFH